MRSVFGIACVMTVVACQPMYGDKAQKLKNPEIRAGKDKVPADPPPPPPPYIDTCTTNFRGVNTGVVRDRIEATRLVKDADEKLAVADKAATVESKGALIVDSIARYHKALTKDPYDSEATLKLALAYDLTYRKGCALAMLGRLETLSNHKDFRAAADRQKGQVRDNKAWFAGYRREALQQIP